MARRQPDVYDEMAGCFGALMFGAIAASIAYVFQSTKTPPEKKLQELNQPTEWGNPIQPLSCPRCQAINENTEVICFSCGIDLSANAIEAPSTSNTGASLTEEETTNVIVIIIFVVAVVALLYLLSLGS